jgi:hypothetical protein
LTESVTPIVTEQAGLTAFAESATDLKTTVPDTTMIDRHISISYPVDTPTQLLQRTYLVATDTWTSVWTGLQLNFPQLLLTNPVIQNTLKQFRYFRANVQVEIRINSTPYHQGSLMVGWLPAWQPAFPVTSVRTLSGCNAVVLAASTQESCTVKLPYLNNIDWMDTSPFVGDGRIAILWILVLNPLLTTSPDMPASLPINVFASFKDIVLEGFISQAKNSKEAVNKMKNGIDATSTVSTVSKILRKAPVIGPAYGAIADFLNVYSGDLEKPVAVTASTPIHAIYGAGALAEGLDYVDPMSLYSNANLAQSKTFAGMETSHMTLNELAMKPILFFQVVMTSVSPSYNVRVTPDDVWAVLPQQSDYLRAVSHAFRYWRGSIKYLFHFCVPAFYSFRVQFSLNYDPLATPANVGDLMNKIIDIKGETWVPIVVPYLRPITWSEVLFDPPDAIPLLTWALITPIVGSSLPATPIVYCNVFRAGGEDMCFSQLVNAQTGSESLSKEKDLYRNDPFVPQCSINDAFKKPFDGLMPGTTQSIEKGFCMPEMAVTVTDCCKRQANHVPIMSFLSYPTACTNTIATAYIEHQPLHYFGSFFQWWRGSRTMRHYQFPYTTNIWGLDNFRGTLLTYADGASQLFNAPTDAYLYHTEAIQLPYYCKVPWSPTLSPAHTTDLNSQIFPSDVRNPPSSNITLQAGDDFMYMHCIPFFLLDYEPTSESETTAASTTAVTSTTTSAPIPIPQPVPKPPVWF